MKDNFENKKTIMIKSIISASVLILFILSFFLYSIIAQNSSKNQSNAKIIKNLDFQIYYIDVGQGNCTFAILPDGKNILIDGGTETSGKKIVKFLKEKNICTIDYLIATHADSDHIGGFLDVLDNFEVKKIFRPFQIAGKGNTADTFIPNETEDLFEIYYLLKNNIDIDISRIDSEEYSRFIEKIYNEKYVQNGVEKSAEVVVFYDGLKVSGERYSIEFFAPFVYSGEYDLSIHSNTAGYVTYCYGEVNSNSCSSIFLLECDGKKFLFTGDAPWSNNDYYDSNYIPKNRFEEIDFVFSLTQDERERLSDVSVYLAGHHGSKYSSGKSLLELIKPEFFVISVEKNNYYGHPSEDTINRFENIKKRDDAIFMTKDIGTIAFGVYEGNLIYCTESEINDDKLSVSVTTIFIVIYIFFVITIFSIRPMKKKKYKL